MEKFIDTDVRFDEQFGFTDSEVRQLLENYHLESHMDETKEWYDGYRFGDTDVYCPWDVINHVDRLRGEPGAEPQSYWINTSGNDLIKRFVDKADKTTRDEIERLVSGECIEKMVRLELTYDEIDNSIDNLWSVLFTTGYLTQVGKADYGIYKLCIPNREIHDVFVFQIQEWFKEKVLKKNESIPLLCQALANGEADVVQEQLNKILGKMISILDTKAREEQKENFYHGILLGLLRREEEWLILSNAELGDGFCNILIETESLDSGIIIELKYSTTLIGLDTACKKALAQIKDRRYGERLRNEGRNEILGYGIAFYKKRCQVVVEKM